LKGKRGVPKGGVEKGGKQKAFQGGGRKATGKAQVGGY